MMHWASSLTYNALEVVAYATTFIRYRVVEVATAVVDISQRSIMHLVHTCTVVTTQIIHFGEVTVFK